VPSGNKQALYQPNFSSKYVSNMLISYSPQREAGATVDVVKFIEKVQHIKKEFSKYLGMVFDDLVLMYSRKKSLTPTIMNHGNNGIPELGLSEHVEYYAFAKVN
jgi:hypothetical protein